MGQVVRVPLVGDFMVRTSDSNVNVLKDQRFTNALFETFTKTDGTNGFFVKKRFGLKLYLTVVGTGTPAARGAYVFNNQVFSAFDSTVYRGTTSIITGLTSLNAVTVRFSEGILLNSLPVLFISDGIKAYTVDTANTVTQITSANLPTPHTPGIAYLDHYAFAANPDKAQIFNSNVNDFYTWNATDYISAELYGDKLVFLGKFNNLLMAMGEYSTEFFENAANPTGSPLTRVTGSVLTYGTPAPASVQEVMGGIIWIARDRAGRFSVRHLEQNFRQEPISTIWIDYILNTVGQFTVSKSYASVIQMAGHEVYLLNIGGGGLSYAYDIQAKMWSHWSSPLGGAIAGGDFPAPGGGILTTGPISDTLNTVVQMDYRGKIYSIDPSVYTDETQAFTWQARTQLMDFGNDKRKFCAAVEVIGDQDASISTLGISYSDNDYKTFSNQRIVDLSLPRARLARLGTFRRRAWKLVHSVDHPVRIEALEVELA